MHKAKERMQGEGKKINFLFPKNKGTKAEGLWLNESE